MQRIFDANDIIEAHIVKGLLEQQNIETYIGGYYLQGGVGDLPVTGNVCVWVADEQRVHANEIINNYQQSS